MKPKRELKTWVKVALLLLPEVVIMGLLFFIAVNYKSTEVTIEINLPEPVLETWEVIYE